MKAVAEIFDQLSGPAAVARLIGTTTEHAATMKRRGSIPVRYWAALVATSKVSERDLVNAHSPSPQAA